VAPDPLRGRGALLHDLSQPESRRREDAWAPINAGLDDLGNWRKFMPQRFVSSSARTVRSSHSREASAIRSESKHCRSNNFRDPPFPQTASADAYVKKCDLAFRLTMPQDFSLPRLTSAFHTVGHKETLRPCLLSEWRISQVRF